MHTDAPDDNLGRGRIEVLELQFTDVAAIHGVGPVAAKALDVEMMGTHAYFLVGVEGYAYLAMTYLLMLLQIDHGLHDFGNARLVVGTQECRAIGDDEVLADVLEQFGELTR